MTYDKEFESWFNDEHVKGDYNEAFKRDIFNAWQAARKDHYRIGEEVENLDGTKKAKICAVVEHIGLNDLGADNVRRIPAKTRIDEIAEEAARKYSVTSADPRPLVEIIKSAILRALEEKEINR